MKILNALRGAILKTLRSAGYDVRKVYKPNPQSPYELICPIASYAPWTKDTDFQEIYSKIKGHTLVDQYRCYELWSLIGQCQKLTGALIEVGVWRGGTAAIMATKAKQVGITDQIYLCDTFSGVVKASAKDSVYKGGEHSDVNLDDVKSLIGSLGVNNVMILQGIFPDQTAGSVTDSQFRFCHIDVDVYQSAKDVLAWVWPKLVVGGIVVYDDYGFKGCEGITAFVEEQANLEDRIIIHNLNGHAVVIKIK